MAKKVHISKDVSDTLLDMGYKLNDKFNSTEDIKVAQTAIAAFNVAIKLKQTQVIYKKMTGTPMKIDFLEN
jgi:hypothetical protein